MSRLLVTFSSSHVAMETELLLEEAGLPVRLIPLPPQVHAGCGLALLCDLDLMDTVLSLMEENRLPHEGLYTGRPGEWSKA